MKVKIMQPIAGNADVRYGLADFSFAPGEQVDLHDDLAAAWVASGIAEPLPIAPEMAAVDGAPETAMLKRPSRKRADG